MISLEELVANFIDTLSVLVWNYLTTLGRCIFSVRSGVYRTVVRGYRTTSKRVGPGTLSFISLVMCYVLSPYAASPYESAPTAVNVVTQAQTLRQDDKILLYLLIAIAMFTTVSFAVTRFGVDLARRRSKASIPPWLDMFRLLRFFPHIAVSTGLLMFVVSIIVTSKAMWLANYFGYDDKIIGQIFALTSLVIVGAYVLVIWPKQGLLLIRRSSLKPQGIRRVDLIIYGTILLGSIVPLCCSGAVVVFAYLQAQTPTTASPVSVGLYCDYSAPSVFYVTVKNPGTVPIFIDEVGLGFEVVPHVIRVEFTTKVKQKDDELFVLEPGATRILRAVFEQEEDSGKNNDDQKDADKNDDDKADQNDTTPRLSDFCMDYKNIHATFKGNFR
jgi:hypothetical protein